MRLGAYRPVLALLLPLPFVGSAWLWWAVPTALSIAGLTLALALIGRDFEVWLNPRRVN